MAAAKMSNKPIKPKQTKSQIYATISAATGVSKKDVSAVIEALADVTRRHLIKGGAGECVVPALGVKVRAIQKPATKARKGRNPFTGEEITIKAKPARLDVRARALKTLKEAVAR
jgi:nucleoid DNA-binding protein